MTDVRDVIVKALEESELEYARHGDDVFEVELPGERKLKTTCRLEVGPLPPPARGGRGAGGWGRAALR